MLTGLSAWGLKRTMTTTLTVAFIVPFTIPTRSTPTEPIARMPYSSGVRTHV